MAKPYQGDDVDYFSAARDEEGNVKQTGLAKSAMPKPKNRIVTKEELKKSGFDNLRDFLNAERGLRRRVKKDSEGKTASGMPREARGVRDDSMSDKDRLRAQLDSAKEASQAGEYGTMKKGGSVKESAMMKKMGRGMTKAAMQKVASKVVKGHEKRMHGMQKGGSVSARADGCAQRGKTKGRMV